MFLARGQVVRPDQIELVLVGVEQFWRIADIGEDDIATVRGQHQTRLEGRKCDGDVRPNAWRRHIDGYDGRAREVLLQTLDDCSIDAFQLCPRSSAQQRVDYDCG